MKALEWSMTIPKEKQTGFEKWFKEIAGPRFNKFGAIKHEIYKVEEKTVVGRQTTEKDRYIERVYFDDDFEIPKYFAAAKADEEAWKESRKFENEFGAKDLELRVLYPV
jgi:hypothetical protein